MSDEERREVEIEVELEDWEYRALTKAAAAAGVSAEQYMVDAARIRLEGSAGLLADYPSAN